MLDIAYTIGNTTNISIKAVAITATTVSILLRIQDV